MINAGSGSGILRLPPENSAAPFTARDFCGLAGERLSLSLCPCVLIDADSSLSSYEEDRGDHQTL
jgi:hypothetical protein